MKTDCLPSHKKKYKYCEHASRKDWDEIEVVENFKTDYIIIPFSERSDWGL